MIELSSIALIGLGASALLFAFAEYALSYHKMKAKIC